MKETLKKITPVILPAIALQLIEFSSMFIDSVMMGQYDPISFGGTSLGASLYFSILTLFLGILLMTAPLIGQASGAKNNRLIARTTRSGVWLGFIFAFIILGIMLFISDICVLLSFDAQTIQTVSSYIEGKKYSAFFLVSLPFRFFLTSQRVFKPVLFISIIILPFNILFNWIFIYGAFGIPEMGAYGAGLATSLAMIISLIATLFLCHKHAIKTGINLWVRFWKIDIDICKRILKYGIWVGIGLMLEMSLFTISNIYTAYFDIYSISAYAVTFQLWNIIFGIMIGLSDGLSIYTAQEAGRQNRSTIIKGIYIAVAGMVIINIMTVIIMVFGSDYIFTVMLDSTSTDFNKVVELIYPIIPIFTIAIIIEGYVQLPTKILQSLNDTKYIPASQALGYLFIAPSVSYVLCFVYDYGLFGIYAGITAGIIITGSLFIARVYYTLHHTRIFSKIEIK